MEDKKELTVEQALLRLEEIVKRLENGGETLDASLALYEEGIGLLRHCSARLDAAQARVRVLSGRTEEGAPSWTPFAEEEA